jgi:hypothetical protein
MCPRPLRQGGRRRAAALGWSPKHANDRIVMRDAVCGHARSPDVAVFPPFPVVGVSFAAGEQLVSAPGAGAT